MGEDCVGDVDPARWDPLDTRLGAVAGKMAEMSAAGGSSLFAGSPDTVTISMARAWTRNGIASPTARAALRLPSQHTMTRSSCRAAV